MRVQRRGAKCCLYWCKYMHMCSLFNQLTHGPHQRRTYSNRHCGCKQGRTANRGTARRTYMTTSNARPWGGCHQCNRHAHLRFSCSSQWAGTGDNETGRRTPVTLHKRATGSEPAGAACSRCWDDCGATDSVSQPVPGRTLGPACSSLHPHDPVHL